MKSTLPAATAKNINDAHRCARESAENAIEWAMKCGQMLSAKKDSIKTERGHGTWETWVEENCDFSLRMAQRYMQAAKNDTRVAFDSLRQALGYDKPKPKSDTQKGAVSVVNPEGGRTTGAKEGTEETGADRPAAPVFDEPKSVVLRPEPESDEPERPDIDDEEEAAALSRAEERAKADRERRIDTILQAEDQLAEAVKQVAQQAALIGVLETTRDGYMRGKEAVTKLLQAEQRKVARLEKENKSLRDRLAALEGKAA